MLSHLFNNKKAQGGILDWIQEHIFILISAIAITVFLALFFKGCEPTASDEACFEQLRIQNYFASKIKEAEIAKDIPDACIPKEPEIIEYKDPTKAEFEVTNLMKRCWDKWGGGKYHLPLPLGPGIQCVPCYTFQPKNLKEPIKKETIASDMKNVYLPNGKSLFSSINGDILELVAENPSLTPDIKPGQYYLVMLAEFSPGWLAERVGQAEYWVADKISSGKLSEATGVQNIEELRFQVVYVDEQNQAGQCRLLEGWSGERLTS